MPVPPRAPAALAAAAALFVSAAAAQAPARDEARTAPRTDPFCWRGRPLPHCEDFALFELGFHTRLASTRLTDTSAYFNGPTYVSVRPDVRSQFLWTVGMMRNRDARTAIGGGVVLGANEQGGVFGLQGRWRRWLGGTMSLDVGLGGARVSTPEPVGRPSETFVGDPARFGVLLDGHLNAGDRIAAGARLVAVPGGGRTRVGLLAGGRLGTNYAVAGTLAVGAFFVALAAALGGAY